MKSVFQTKPDNCLAACLASILEVDIDEIPDLTKSRDYVSLLRDYLASKEISLIWLYCPELVKSYVGYNPEYCIAIGKSPRSETIKHAVVARPNGYGYEIIHDPHDSEAGLDGSITSVIYLGRLLP